VLEVGGVFVVLFELFELIQTTTIHRNTFYHQRVLTNKLPPR
jgi:hypothetical protein